MRRSSPGGVLDLQESIKHGAGFRRGQGPLGELAIGSGGPAHGSKRFMPGKQVQLLFKVSAQAKPQGSIPMPRIGATYGMNIAFRSTLLEVL